MYPCPRICSRGVHSRPPPEVSRTRRERKQHTTSITRLLLTPVPTYFLRRTPRAASQGLYLWRGRWQLGQYRWTLQRGLQGACLSPTRHAASRVPCEPRRVQTVCVWLCAREELGGQTSGEGGLHQTRATGAARLWHTAHCRQRHWGGFGGQLFMHKSTTYGLVKQFISYLFVEFYFCDTGWNDENIFIIKKQ